MPIRRKLAAGCAIALLLALPVRADTPLSAIDWLSQSLARPAPALTASEPGVAADGALPADVSVSVLDGPSPDAAGVLAPEITGFPRALWGLGQTRDIIAAIAAPGADSLPALQGLLMTVILAQADPPSDSGPDHALLIARVDRLLSAGALEQASALLEAAGPAVSADLFRRSFDVALLTGEEAAACARMRQTPGLAPSLTARVFCLARAGDWNAAALILQTAEALGQVTEPEGALLQRFLDPDLTEGEPTPPPPKPVTPLVLRIYEAIGEPLPTATMPLAFAYAELSDRAGWKAQIEAAERLTRAGAIAPNVLLGLYTKRAPAASGGVWDRADAFQRFDAALARGEPEAVARFLAPAYAQMRAAELEVPFATLFAEDLARIPLPAAARALAFEIGLLSPGYEGSALAPYLASATPQDARAAFLAGLAKGSVAGLAPPDSMARTIAPAFTTPAISPEYAALLEQDRLGEAILRAIARISTGLQGNFAQVTDGLALLRHVGLEDVARRTALQLMLLERRG